ncbi:hypothetical protein HHI36_006438, partial [Cryptolaemus montrouzieri]
MWKTLKSLVNPKNGGSCFNGGILFEIDGVRKDISSKDDIARNFNMYFVQSIQDITNTIQDGPEW